MAIVSDIEIRLAANIAALRQDMEQARQTVSNSMAGISKAAGLAGAALGALAGVLSVGAFAGWIKGAIDATDAVSDISQRTGIAIKDIAGLQMWFQKGGTEAGAFESSMIKLSKKIAEGGAEFSKLGIKTRDANGALRSNVDVLLESADAFASMEDGTAKTALAVELFGKSGAELIPLLNEGSAGLVEMNKAAEQLGLTFDEKTVEAAGQFNDTLDLLAAASQGVARQVAAQLLPTLNSLSETMLEFVTTGDKVRGAADVIGTGFKLIYTAGVLVTQAFNIVGKTIGAAAGQLLSFFQLDFKQAIGIGQAWSADMKDIFTSTAKTIGDTWTGAGGKVVAALAKTTNAGTVSAGETAKAVKQQVSAYQGLIDAIQGKITESDREAMGLAKLTESQKLAMALDAGLTNGKIKLTVAEEGYYRMLIETLGASEQAAARNKELAESHKLTQKAADDVAKLMKQVGAERDKEVETVVKEAEANEELARTFGMTKAALAELAIARAQDNLERAKSAGDDYDEIQRLEKIIEAKKRSAAAIADVEDLQKQKDLWKSIEETAHDTFVSILDGGKDAATRLKDTFKNIFFEWLYQQTLKKWIINLEGNASLSGSSGGGNLLSSLANMFGNSGGASGGSGFMGGASNLLSIGKTIYSGFSTGITSTLGSVITSMGETFGSAAMTSFGNGLFGGAGSAMSGAAGAGASAASAIPIIGWIIAGMNAANGFFKQGFDMQNGTVKDPLGLGSGIKTVDKLFRGIGMSDKMANIFSGQAVFAKLFGRANPVVEAEGLFGSFDGGGANSGRFANILEKGGVFRSDKRYRAGQYSSDEFDNGLTETYHAIKAVTGGLAQTLGVSTDKLNDFSKTFEIVFDKDVAKREQQIADLFKGLGDDIATYLIPNIATFAQAGETASATLQRLAGEFQSVNATFQVIGVDATKAFGAVGLASVEARTRLLDLAGGVDALAAQTGFFAQNFLTDAERVASVQKAVADQLAALGYAGVKTTDQFKGAVMDLVNGGGLATEAGARTYAALLALAPAFKTVADYTDQLTAAQKAAADALAQAQADAVAALQAAAGETMAALRRSIDAERGAAQDSFNALMKGIQASIDATTAKITDLQALSQALRSAGVSGVDGMQAADRRAAADAQITAALAIARAGGVLPKADDLRDALAAVAIDVADQYSNAADYQRDQLRTANTIEELAGLTDTELSIAQRTLTALQDQKTAAQMQFDAQMAKYDEMLEKAQMQLDAINGVDVSVLTQVEAFQAFAQSIADALKNQTIANQPSVTGATQIEALYNSVLGRTSDAAGLAYYLDLLKKGASLANIEQDIRNSAEYASRTASIYNTQQSGTMAAGGEQSAINKRMEDNMARTAAAVEQLATQFNQVSAGGNALATEVMK